MLSISPKIDSVNKYAQNMSSFPEMMRHRID